MVSRDELRAFGAILARRMILACGEAEFPDDAERALGDWDVDRKREVEAAIDDYFRRLSQTQATKKGVMPDQPPPPTGEVRQNARVTIELANGTVFQVEGSASSVEVEQQPSTALPVGAMYEGAMLPAAALPGDFGGRVEVRFDRITRVASGGRDA